MATGDLGTILINLTRYANGKVATLTISRPSKLNSLNTHLINLLPKTLTEVTQRNQDLIAIVITGDGNRAFVGGADIAEMANIDSPAAARAFISRIHLACKSIRDCPVPVIGMVNGYALGGGLDIAVACDFRVASRDAVLGMPEVRFGVPSVIEAALFPGLIGWGRTRMLLMMGENISADEALKWGLVEKVVEPEMLNEAVDDWIKCLEQNGICAVRGQKALIRKWEQVGLAAGIEAGIEQFGQAYELPDLGEYTCAMGKESERRRPSEPIRMMGDFVKRRAEKERKAGVKL